MKLIVNDDYPLTKLISSLEGYNKTCSIIDLREGCTTFIRHISYVDYLRNTNKNIAILCPFELYEKFPDDLSDNIVVIFVKDVDFAFTCFHNYIHRRSRPKKNIIGRNCRIHPSVIIGVEGIKFANDPNGSKLQFIHTGEVIIGNDIDIGANSIIHRGSLGSTIVKDGVKIGVMVNIGHNNIIGKNTIVVGGTITSGSVVVGDNCWLCAGSLIRNGVSICNNVIVGMGSLVLKDIKESGMYVGRPAIRIGDYLEGFNL